MKNNNQANNSFFNLVSKYVKDNLKFLIISVLLIFFIFLVYQGYSFYNLNKINNLSISYFSNKDLDDHKIKFSELSKISDEKSFYSLLSKIELIKNHISKNESDEALNLYNEILNSKKFDSNYVSLIAINAAYNFLDIVIKNNNDKYISNIKKFISLIDESFDNYVGYKKELLYLVSVLSLNDDSSYKNNSELLTLFDNLMNNQKISSTIKERVNKIHEFYIFI